MHDNYEVYCKERDLDTALASSKSVTQFIRTMVDKIYTPEALANSTPQGFPARSQGKKKLKKGKVLPRLHPDGREALLGEFNS